MKRVVCNQRKSLFHFAGSDVGLGVNIHPKESTTELGKIVVIIYEDLRKLALVFVNYFGSN